MFKLPFLNDTLHFPPVESAHASGLLAAGGDLSVHRLILAYSLGIFPWFNENDPYLWWSPDPRFVLFTKDFHLTKRQERSIRNANFLITTDSAFDKVIEYCAKIPRTRDQNTENATWITKEMINAYKELFEEGFAHSVEVWQKKKPENHINKISHHLTYAKILEKTCDHLNQDMEKKNTLISHDDVFENFQLVGGLYGVCMGHIFCGESMFHLVPEASRAALAYLINAMKKCNMPLIDSQQKTEHMARIGAKEIPRKEFLNILNEGIQMYGTGHERNFLKS